MTAHPRLTQRDYARQAAASAPTPTQIARVTRAMLAPAPQCMAKGTFNGWTWDAYDSPYTPGMVLFGATREGHTTISVEVACVEAGMDLLTGCPK